MQLAAEGLSASRTGKSISGDDSVARATFQKRRKGSSSKPELR